MKKRNEIIEFLKTHHKLLLLSVISLVLFHNYIVLIALFFIFGILGIASLKVSTVVPHISIETISASATLIGYVWGWKLGLAFGLLFGFYSIITLSFVKLKTIINVLLMGICGVVAAIFASLNYSFTVAFMLTFIIRIVLNNIIFPLVEPDMMENLMHAFGDPIFNMLITYQFMNVIYNIIMYLR